MKLLAATWFVALALGGLATQLQAAEAYGAYDGFGAPRLDSDRWNALERTRQVRSGALNMVQRDLGSQLSDTGSTGQTFATSMRNPASITQMRATVVVADHAVTACPGRTEASDVQARIGGFWFNAGPSVPGSYENDVLALVRVIRSTASADPAGVLRAEGVIARCNSADCATSVVVESRDLGTVAQGVQVALRIDWEQAAHRFVFRRDSETPVAVPYTLADGLPPTFPSKDLSTRTRLAQCFSGPRTEGHIDVRFDNVQVNSSALP